jgi:hypothetical protein
MTQKDLDNFKNWFSEHTSSFQSSDETDRKNLSVKIHHTHQVCENARTIADNLQISKNEQLLVETSALFHDVGRFTQYAQYRTFKDSISENHGRLGEKVLLQEEVLRNLSESERELIVDTVKFHCALSLPKSKDPKTIFFLKLIRDADKLDIWRVFVDYYNAGKHERTSAVGQELSDTQGYSERVLSCIYEKRMALLSQLKTLNDFKLMQLSWVFDVNFNISFRLLLERGHIDNIAATLPQSDEVRKATGLVLEHINKKAQEINP